MHKCDNDKTIDIMLKKIERMDEKIDILMEQKAFQSGAISTLKKTWLVSGSALGIIASIGIFLVEKYDLIKAALK